MRGYRNWSNDVDDWSDSPSGGPVKMWLAGVMVPLIVLYKELMKIIALVITISSGSCASCRVFPSLFGA